LILLEQADQHSLSADDWALLLSLRQARFDIIEIVL
jgi:hypothetical protein